MGLEEMETNQKFGPAFDVRSKKSKKNLPLQAEQNRNVKIFQKIDIIQFI